MARDSIVNHQAGSSHRELQQRYDDLQQRYDEYRQQTQEYEGELETEIESLRQQLALALAAQQTEPVTTKDTSAESIDDLRERCRERDAELAYLQEQLEIAISEKSVLKSQVNQLELQNSQLTESLGTRLADLHQLQFKCNALDAASPSTASPDSPPLVGLLPLKSTGNLDNLFMPIDLIGSVVSS